MTMPRGQGFYRISYEFLKKSKEQIPRGLTPARNDKHLEPVAFKTNQRTRGYSMRRAFTGSSVAARRAGQRQARSAINDRTNATITKVRGSRELP